MSVTLSAQIFTVLTGIVIIFQACLAAGMPWGAASMGGKYPGVYPPKMRIVALVNIVVLMFLAIIVLSKAGLLFPQLLPFSKIAIWFVVVFLLLGSVMNSITPSKIERIWAPVAFIQFITSLIVALH
jgi:phosphoglycerol transferase MdoB-like AlkP superfamily enzyme